MPIGPSRRGGWDAPHLVGPDRLRRGRRPGRGTRRVARPPAPRTVGTQPWLDALTIPQFQTRIAAGSLSSKALTGAYLRRIAALDDDVNAVLKLNPTRSGRGRGASDVYRAAHGPRSRLEGVPVLLKDNIDTADLGDTAGSRALLGAPARPTPSSSAGSAPPAR